MGILGTLDTGRIRTRHKDTAQCRKLKRGAACILPNTEGEPMCSRRVSSSYHL